MSHYVPGHYTQTVSEYGPSILRDHAAKAAPADFYRFRPAPLRKLLHIKISGFWTLDTVAAFALDLRGAVARLGTAPGEHLVCCDVSDASIQPQDIVIALQNLIANGPTKAHKLALFTTRLLSRMQARRIIGVRDNIAMFDTETAAMLWLTADPGTEA